MAASLDDRNSCRVHEIGEANGQIFLVMGDIDGPELGAKIKEARCRWTRRCESPLWLRGFARRICAGL